jgi:hypothetical protein
MATILYLHGHARQVIHSVELAGTAPEARVVAPTIAHAWHAPYWRIGRARLVPTLDCLPDNPE